LRSLLLLEPAFKVQIRIDQLSNQQVVSAACQVNSRQNPFHPSLPEQCLHSLREQCPPNRNDSQRATPQLKRGPANPKNRKKA